MHSCPRCNKEASIISVWKDHFAICRDCKVAWHIGWNLFTVEKEEWENARKNLGYLEDNFTNITDEM